MVTEPLVDAVNEIEKAKVLLGYPIDLKVDALRSVGMHDLANYLERMVRQAVECLDDAQMFIHEDTNRQVNASLEEVANVIATVGKL